MEKSGKKNFLIDGFPRNQDNLEGWNKAMTGVADVKMVLFFSCPEQVEFFILNFVHMLSEHEDIIRFEL